MKANELVGEKMKNGIGVSMGRVSRWDNVPEQEKRDAREGVERRVIVSFGSLIGRFQRIIISKHPKLMYLDGRIKFEISRMFTNMAS